MPRLLLVDDNPSIHRIAESLLAGSSVELVCVDSAESALEKLNGGERFDIALLDTVMPGMDGWQLLDRIRATPALEEMPVAMMAGVLDAVDQGRLDSARIQGFLKKPIELRDLNDRVQAILAQSNRSSFATVPGAKLEGWGAGDRDVSMFDVPSLPPEVDAALAQPESESDLLILGPEDLLEEPALKEIARAEVTLGEAAPEPAAHHAPDLVLEELDMEGLHALPHADTEAEPASAHTEDLGLGDLGELPEPAVESAEPALPNIHSMDLSAVDPAQMAELEAPAPVPEAAPVFALPASLSGMPEAAPMASAMPMAETPAAPAAQAAMPAPIAAPAGGTMGAMDADALARAIASDPALLDALVKAVVAHAGDKVLREIAWELMPDLAAKLKH